MRYIPFPIPLESQTLHSPFTVGQTLKAEVNFNNDSTNGTLYKHEALYLVAEADMIALDGDSRYRLLKQADLAACIQKNHIYLCDQLTVLGTELEDTCLGSLYSKNPSGVRSHCRLVNFV